MACHWLTEDADFGKKNHLSRWSSFWSWLICKQAKLSDLGHRKPARIHWKADTPKTSHCLMRILVHRPNWTIFLWKWARRGHNSQWRLLSGHVERIFVHNNWIGGYWQHLGSTGRCYVPHSRSYTRCFAPCFWRPHYQLQSWCRLATSELWFDSLTECYADKPETIDALEENIREAIPDIKLHTIDNMLKNWTDRVQQGQPRQPFDWNYFQLLTGRIVLSNKKKKKLRKY